MTPIAKPPVTPAALLALILLTACAGDRDTGGDGAATGYWVGRPVSELVGSWGQPDVYTPLADGSEVVEYRPNRPGDACAARFRVGSDGLIASAEGVGADCGPQP